MKSILLIDNHEKVRRLYSVNLEAYTGADIIEMDSIDNAMIYLEDDDADIVIVRGKMDQRNADEIVSQYLND